MSDYVSHLTFFDGAFPLWFLSFQIRILLLFFIVQLQHLLVAYVIQSMKGLGPF